MVLLYFTAVMMAEQNKALMRGFIRAIADTKHPLQTSLSIILTDFEPNGNKQAIPRAEAENILKSAINAPLKINFDGHSYAGHIGAIPIGPIVSAYESTDNGREVIAGEAVIWNDIYDDVADHLKKAFASGVGTSWEIYYSDSTQDDNDVQWLEGCIFAGTCIVDVPAYGPNRTRVLAIAEKLDERAEILEKLTMADNEVETPIEEVDTPAVAADTTIEDISSVRQDISSVLDVISNIYGGLYDMLDETYEIEANLATTDMPAMADQFSKLLGSITKRFNDLKDKAGMAESAIAELTTLKDTIEQAEAAKAEAEKLNARRTRLAEAGIELTEETLQSRRDFYLDMSDSAFDQYLADLTLVRGKASAELTTPVIPDPTNGSNTQNISTKELAGLIIATLKR